MGLKEVKDNVIFKIQLAKAETKKKAAQAFDWCMKNPEMAVAIGGGVLALAKPITKGVIKHVNLKKEEDFRDRSIYDRSAGHYVYARRKISNNEWLEIDRRRKNGEPISYILDSMHLLG